MKIRTSAVLTSALAFAVVVSTSSAAHAQFSVAGFGGATVPTGGDRSDVRTGWLAGIYGAYRFSDLIGARLDLAYSESTVKDPSPGVPADLTLSYVYDIAYLVFHVVPRDQSAMDVYIGAGGGVVWTREAYGPQAPPPVTDQTFTSTVGALSGMLGAGVPVARSVRIFGDGRFITIFTDGATNQLMVDVGLEIVFGGL